MDLQRYNSTVIPQAVLAGLTLIALGQPASSPTYGLDDDCAPTWAPMQDYGVDIGEPSSNLLGLATSDEPGDSLYETVRSELMAYSELSPDWDGPGSRAPLGGALDSAIAFLEDLPGGIAIPTASITSSGEPTLYWDESSFFIDVGFEQGEAVSLFGKSKRTGEQLFFDDIPADRALAVFLDLMGQLTA